MVVVSLIIAGVILLICAILYIIAIILGFVIGGKAEGCDNVSSIGKALSWVLISTAILLVIFFIVLFVSFGRFFRIANIASKVKGGVDSAEQALKACAGNISK